MAWATVDLVTMCREEAQEPTGEGTRTTDVQWYALLSRAQLRVFRLMATTVPHANVGVAVQLSTSDNGLTYTFPSSKFPLGYCEVREGLDGRILWAGPNYSWSNDFVFEGDLLRTPNGQARTYSAGVYARYITTPPDLAVDVQPTLTPDWARVLMVYDAVMEWADQGGLRDPEPWRRKFNRAWQGDPDIPGDVGILGALRTQLRMPGMDPTRNRRFR